VKAVYAISMFVLLGVSGARSTLGEETYTLRSLGTLGAYAAEVKSMNESAQAVGTLETGFIPEREHAFLSSAGETRELHAAVLQVEHCVLMRSDGRFIADSGLIVGWVWCSGAELRRGWPGHSFAYVNGAVTELRGVAGRGTSKAFPVGGQDGVHLWEIDAQGSAHDTGRLEGASGFPTAMNARGEVVGWSVTASISPRAWLWSDRRVQDLGTLGGPSSKAFAINDSGDVVGAADLSGDERHAFLYRHGAMRDLSTLGGRVSVAYDINASGQIVGWSAPEPDVAGAHASSRGRAFLYENGQMKDLNRRLVGPEAQFVTLQEAVAINEAGVIAANGMDSRDSGLHAGARAYLLTPTSTEHSQR